jgi:hypothetical protein
VFCTFERHISEINLSDQKVLKKFIGIEDNLGAYPDARGSLIDGLKDLIKSVEVLPASSDYRRAIEATAQYRLKVLAENESDLAAEEVLDSHLEELILECREELNLLPLMTGAYNVQAPLPSSSVDCREQLACKDSLCLRKHVRGTADK